jgi:nucleotide-binding universal stress UspA family protein
MEQKIIVYQTNYSECSENTLDYVKSIAKGTEAKLKVIHSLDLIGLYATQITPAETSMLIQSLEESAEAYLVKIKEKLEKEFILCETELLNGSKANWLPKVLKQTKPYLLIVLGIGSDEVENRIFGSLTHKIISKEEFPILAVPKFAKYKGIKKIVLRQIKKKAM